ncbi:hypothetical protein [Capnocytophaga sp.]|nr:hypothetical protein [Capnocytophaga sp.]MDO5104345.1 hypothetical protein [Capnocytophaga sp.]
MEEIKKMIHTNLNVILILCLMALLIGTLIGVYVAHNGFAW